jgi:acetylornithine deacetylase
MSFILAPRGVNALEYGGELIRSYINCAAHCRNGPFNQDFDPPYTTINVGILTAVVMANIVPNRRIALHMRPIPEHSSDEIVAVREYAFRNSFEP